MKGKEMNIWDGSPEADAFWENHPLQQQAIERMGRKNYEICQRVQREALTGGVGHLRVKKSGSPVFISSMRMLKIPLWYRIWSWLRNAFVGGNSVKGKR